MLSNLNAKSLVNYGTDSDEDNISDEEEVVVAHKNGVNSNKIENEDSFLEIQTKIKLPQPMKVAISSVEEDDEFLHKKEVPELAPPPPTVSKVRQKVKITIPKLSDFKDDDDEKDEGPKYPTATNKNAGLLGLLPKPTHSLKPMSKKQISIPPSIQKSTPSVTQAVSSTTTTVSSGQEKKKVGFIPYALMEHKKASDNKMSSKTKGNDSDDSDDDDDMSKPFFSFSSKDDDLPNVNEDEIKAMVERETNRIEERKRQAEMPNQSEYEQDYTNSYEPHQQRSEFDQEAMKALVGGTKAKRSKLDDIQIVDIAAHEVLPDREEWLRKSLAGETSFMATGKIDEKVRQTHVDHKNKLLITLLYVCLF